MGQLAELFIVGLLIVGGIYVYKHPEIIEQIKTELGNIGNKTGGNTGGNTTETEESGGNTNKGKEEEEEEEEEEEPKKKSSKFVAVYSSKPSSVIRTPATIY